MNFRDVARSKWQANEYACRPTRSSISSCIPAICRGALAFYTGVLGWRPERIHAGDGSYLALGMGNRLGGRPGRVRRGGGAPALAALRARSPTSTVTTDRAQRPRRRGPARAPREGPEGWRSVVSTPDGGEVAFWQSKTER